ncbi:MAG: peptidylprolyl isomerase [Ottowia sp.]|nr:peptidylprolyl isomerase [Ottowia sp.]
MYSLLRCVKKWRSAVCCALLLSGSVWAQPAQEGKDKILDEVAAVANNNLITRGEMVRRAELLRQLYLADQKPVPAQPDLWGEALELLILENIQLQEARDTGLVVSNAELDHIVGQVAQEHKLTMSELRREVEREFSFAKYLEELRKKVLISRLRDRDVLSKTKVFESEIDNYLAEQKKRGNPLVSKKLAQMQLRHIVLRISKEMNEVEAVRRLRTFRERVQNGGDFSVLARQYSQDASATQGGELGWLFTNDIPVEFLRPLDELVPGKIADPVILQNSAYLIQLLNRREVELSAEQQREYARGVLREHKNSMALRDWLQQLRENATVDYRVNRIGHRR